MAHSARSTFIVLIVLPLALALVGQESVGQSSQVVTARAGLVEAFRAVQMLDFQGVSGSETGVLVEELNMALSNLKMANETGSDSYASLSVEISSQVSTRSQIAKEAAERQTLLTRLTAYSFALLMGLVSSMIIVDVDLWKRSFQRRKIASVGVD